MAKVTVELEVYLNLDVWMSTMGTESEEAAEAEAAATIERCVRCSLDYIEDGISSMKVTARRD